MPDPEKEKDRWFDLINQHLTAISLILGGELAVVGLISSLSPQVAIPDHEKVIITAIAGGILLQAHLWLRQIKRNRQIGFNKYNASLNEKYFTEEEAKKFLEREPINSNTARFFRHINQVTVDSLQNTKEGEWLDESIIVTIFLIFLLFGLRIWS